MDKPMFWRSLVGAGTVGLAASLIASCAPSAEVIKIKLEGGRVFEFASTRSGVVLEDCGTQLLGYLFEDGRLVDSKSERGQALHCPLLGAVIEGGAHVGSAALIANGAARAARAAASASNSLTITNTNEGYVGGEYSNNIGQTQTQSALGGNGGESIPPPPPPTQTPPGGHKPKGNSGFGNGGGDGEHNGKQDHTR